MNDKFLTDGRKVRVIGKLNNNESIVQEIYIDEGGSEIPSGDNFTAKNLHDAPVETYTDREIKKKKAKLVSIESEITNICRKEKLARQELKKINLLLKSSTKLIDSIGENDIGIMADFITGQIEYLVFDDYKITPPVKMEDQIFSYDSHYGERTVDDLKLVSVMGRSGGDLAYRLHSYCDGSGSSKEVFPFTNYDDAINKIKEFALKFLESERLSIDDFNTCKSLGITFDEVQVASFKKIATKSLRNSIESSAKSIADCSERRVEAEQKINDIEAL